MALRVNTNVGALQAQRALSLVSARVDSNLQRLSSGLRINSAADDAAGLAVSEKLSSDIRGYNQDTRNANDGISLIQVGESALGEISSSLSRLRELALQSSNGTLSDTDRLAIDSEFQALTSEIDRIAKTTDFSGTNPLNNTNSVSIQVGLNSGGNNVISLTGVNATKSSLGLSGLSVSTQSKATGVLDNISTALTSVSSFRASFGAVQNRLQVSIRNLSVAIENSTAAASRIRDVDVASEASELAKNQIIQQAAVASLAQANVSGQLALKLIG
ncbi:MAG: flagellin FliC [Deltaproteobacteria bacterium]|nr:flagellin FliC [Deltaproteobacteria bacterium]